MENRIRFEVPTQVMFNSFEGDYLCAGIAYKDEIICACCGGVFDIDDLADFAAENDVEQFIFPCDEWADLTREIAEA